MFEISLIGTSAKSRPFKEPEFEIPPVELVTELVEVDLQEFSLYVMVGIKYVLFCVADGNMHPRQNLSHFLLVIHDESLVGSHRPVLLKGGVCAGTISNDIVPCSIFGVSVEAFKSSVTSIFYVPYGFRGIPFLSGGNVRKAAPGHDRDGSPALASTQDSSSGQTSEKFRNVNSFLFLHYALCKNVPGDTIGMVTIQRTFLSTMMAFFTYY